MAGTVGAPSPRSLGASVLVLLLSTLCASMRPSGLLGGAVAHAQPPRGEAAAQGSEALGEPGPRRPTVAPDAVVVDPALADPAGADPGLADSGLADSGVADSGVADSGVADSGVGEVPSSDIDLEAVLRGQGRGLTADQAAARAIATAPSVERSQAVSRQAQAGARRALYGLLPQLGVSLRYTRLSELQNPSLFQGPSVDPEVTDALVAGVDDPEARLLWTATIESQRGLSDFQFPILLDQYAFRASVTYPLSDVFVSVWPAYEGAEENVAAMRLREQAARQDVALRAREAFYDYARARGALAVSRISLEQAQSRYEQVQAFVAAGTAAAVDELRMRAQRAAAQVAVARAEGGVRLASTALSTLLHLEPGARIAVGEDVLRPLPPLPGPVPRLVERARAERAELDALRHLMRAAGHQATAAEGSRYPHLVVQANLDYANPNPRVFPQTDEFRETWDVSAVLSWSLHDLLDGEEQANEARAQRDRAREDLEALEDAVRLQVVEAATSYEAARRALEAARLGLEAAQESYRVQMERYRAGASTVTDLTDASAEQLRAQLDLVNSAIDARVAWARLTRAIGQAEPEAARRRGR